MALYLPWLLSSNMLYRFVCYLHHSIINLPHFRPFIILFFSPYFKHRLCFYLFFFSVLFIFIQWWYLFKLYFIFIYLFFFSRLILLFYVLHSIFRLFYNRCELDDFRFYLLHRWCFMSLLNWDKNQHFIDFWKFFSAFDVIAKHISPRLYRFNFSFYNSL